jgi:hypothetical protein
MYLLIKYEYSDSALRRSLQRYTRTLSIVWVNSPTTRLRTRRGERMYSFYSFMTSALDGVSGQRHGPVAVYAQGKDHQYPLYRGLGGPQCRSGHRGYRKNPLPLPGIEPRSPGRPVHSQTLYRLSFPGSTYYGQRANITFDFSTEPAQSVSSPAPTKTSRYRTITLL